MLHVSSLNIQVLLFRPDFSPKLRELTLYSMSGINTHIFIYIYTFIPSTLPPHRRIHNISKTSYYKTWGGHEWTQDPWSCKDEYKTGHKISPWQIQYHDKFSIKSRALNQPSSDIIKFHKNVVYCHHHYQHHHHHHKWRLISEKVKRVGKTKVHSSLVQLLLLSFGEQTDVYIECFVFHMFYYKRKVMPQILRNFTLRLLSY